tara:strand:+ start:75674 stop:76723 length:1050 start_codon:yes stop_codon:yes gene_type:complete
MTEKQQSSTIGFFEKWLTLWVLLCMVAGITLGYVIPNTVQAIGHVEFSHVNIPVAILIWLMIIPMLIRVDLTELSQVKNHWRGITITLAINWLVKPFTMALLAWVFIKHLFAGWLPAHELDSYIAGLIILSAAPCTAMVFVWSYLCKGDANFTLTQVAVNDVIMIFAFAPLVGLLLGITNIHVPWDTLLYSVGIYIIIPFFIAQLIRAYLIKQGQAILDRALKHLHPISLIALLAMLVLLFSFQGETLVHHPVIVLLIAIPILIQVYFSSMGAYLLNKFTGEQHAIAGPSALIGASNFFELAVATAISLFGFNSGAALATVVGVLVEVPVMLSVVSIVMRTKKWYEKSS